MRIEPENRHHTYCACLSDEHTLSYVFDKEYKEIYTAVYLRPEHNKFKRIWKAIKYIFGYTSRYGHWDSTILEEEEIKLLHAWLGEKIEAVKEDNKK